MEHLRYPQPRRTSRASPSQVGQPHPGTNNSSKQQCACVQCEVALRHGTIVCKCFNHFYLPSFSNLYSLYLQTVAEVTLLHFINAHLQMMRGFLPLFFARLKSYKPLLRYRRSASVNFIEKLMYMRTGVLHVDALIMFFFIERNFIHSRKKQAGMDTNHCKALGRSAIMISSSECVSTTEIRSRL